MEVNQENLSLGQEKISKLLFKFSIPCVTGLLISALYNIVDQLNKFWRMRMTSRFERFSLAISEINRCWHKIASDEMAKYGLKGPYAIYLTAMLRHPDGITAARLGELCARDKSDVSRAISEMIARGMVVRLGDGARTYRVGITLTDIGREAAEHIESRAKLAVETGGRGLGEEHRELLYEALELIVENLRGVCEIGLGDSDKTKNTEGE